LKGNLLIKYFPPKGVSSKDCTTYW
jgi:hypothetical protein